jgi:hypothetical protein
MLIIGAGVAGIAAAVRSVDHDIHSLVLEKEEKALTRFGACSSRWVEPTHYDWPAEHWNQGYLSGLPLKYRALPASGLAAEWEKELIRLDEEGHLTFRTDVEDFKISAPDPTIKIELGFDVEPNEFDLVLHCEGPGEEKCSVGDYVGYQFWQTDGFEQIDVSVPKGVVPKVLISGSGDGALQDFIRIATGLRSVGQFFREVAGENEVRLRRYVHSAEDQALRCSFWDSHKSNPHTRLSLLDSIYQSAIDGLSSREPDLRSEIWQRMDKLIWPRVQDGRIIHLAHSCTHLSACYPLNHIAARLAMTYLSAIDAKQFTFLPNTATTNITPTTHRCESAEKCHGKDHTVTFLSGACADHSGFPLLDKGIYNVIVVRHGVRRPDRDHRARFQLLPYYLDDVRA